jgi:flavin-dependent dehydrogenase
MDIPRAVDVVIWGAGIAGSRIAVELAQMGRSVVIVPRGPASYPEFPGFGDVGGTFASRVDIEKRLVEEAEAHGAYVLHDESISALAPEAGLVSLVATGQRTVVTRCLVFADGADPRIGRARGLLPDWEPWQLVHFAYQLFDADGATEPVTIAGSRDGFAWRGYRIPTPAGTMVAAGWFLMNELDSHVHVTEVLADAVTRFGIASAPLSQPAVEVAPYEPRRIASALAVHNLIVAGDLVGIVNPMSLRRVEISVKMAQTVSQVILKQLAGNGPVLFDAKQVRSALQDLVQPSWQNDDGPPMPDVPRPPSQDRGIGMLVRRIIDRS